MKQISTGTGLVVLSGTILASVFLSSPRTATTAFASAQQAQPAERSIGGNRGSNAAMVADCQSTESLQWFSATPKEIQGCITVVVAPNWRDLTNSNLYPTCLVVDINNDGNVEFLSMTNFQDTDSENVSLFLSTIEIIDGKATTKLVSVCNFSSSLINEYRTSVGLPNVGKWLIAGARDCDNDGDLDLVISSGYSPTFMYFENIGFQHTSPLEGDLNHDGQVDNADVGVLLLHFDA